VNARTRAVKETTRTTNRLRQLAHAVNPFYAQRIDTYRHAIAAGAITAGEIEAEPFPNMHPNRRAAIRRLAKQPPAPIPDALRRALITTAADLDTAHQREAAAEADLIEALNIYPSAAVERWQTIPGGTPLFTAAILVAVGDPLAVDVDQFKAALGAYPQLEHSGTTTRGRSTKKGYRPAMNALYLWTMNLINVDLTPPNPIRTYYAGGEKAGGKKMTAAKAKLARVLWAVARDPEGYKYEESK
jgi:transposase